MCLRHSLLVPPTQPVGTFGDGIQVLEASAPLWCGSAPAWPPRRWQPSSLGTEKVSLGVTGCHWALLGGRRMLTKLHTRPVKFQVPVLSWCLEPGSGVPQGTRYLSPKLAVLCRVLRRPLPADPFRAPARREWSEVHNGAQCWRRTNSLDTQQHE